MPELLEIAGEVLVNGEVTQGANQTIQMDDPADYGYQPGVLTFRGGPQRQNASYGVATVEEEKLEVAWTLMTDSLVNRKITYGGGGWTGQPLLVKWHKEIREMMNLNEKKINIEGLVEVIYPSQDGKIYFLDLQDGKRTREEIEVGYPLGGTASIDSRGYPLLYAGQSEDTIDGATGTNGMRIFNLVDQTQMHLESGRNLFALNDNGAVVTSALVEAGSDSLIYTASNGLLYTLKLNTDFPFMETYKVSHNALTIDPKVTAYRYKSNVRGDNLGIEGSVAVYGNYAYFADYLGVLQCVDMNTMQCVWAVALEDNVDATIALEDEGDGKIALYTANTIQRRKNKKTSDVSIRRYDALTGAMEWEYLIPCRYNKTVLAGAMASPIVGQGDINDLVIFTINNTENQSDMIALEKATGDVIWQTPLDVTTYSSPTAVYTADGTSYIIQADDNGSLRMLDGFNGNHKSSVSLGMSSTIVSSPAVYNNMIVIATDSRIYGVTIK